ncbi:MAG: hypothetical protein HOQ22_16360 [Nocardioidaceae bacterium]|nr:hypothetical protein [Nocardioidaceae bacterium]NUS52600.1 hypothetical protein [Nocardioidaceae bacterium]
MHGAYSKESGARTSVFLQFAGGGAADRKLFEVANAVPGIGIRADDAAITAMARRPDVVRISPIPTRRRSTTP